MTNCAPFLVFGSVADVKMTEETDVHRDLHVFPLDNIGMAAAAVEIYSPSMLREMRFVIKDDLPSGEIHFRFNQSHFMASCLQAFGIRHIRKRSWVISAGNKAELS